MLGLVPASTSFFCETKTWMAGSSPAMTVEMLDHLIPKIVAKPP
jgi:hypothetical protein